MDTQDTVRHRNTSAADRSDTRPSFVSGAEPLTGFSPGGWALSDDMSAALARNWWAIALRGVFAIVFGVIALLMPGVTISALVLLFAAYMLIDGVFTIVAAVRAARHHERWGWLVLEGIADLVAGAIALVWPLATVLGFVWLIGAWAIVSGTVLTIAGFRLSLPHGRGWMVFSGVVSLIWGVMLIIWPIAGAVVLTWWMAVYALFFGGALLVLAFRLRARRHDQRPRSGPLPQST